MNYANCENQPEVVWLGVQTLDLTFMYLIEAKYFFNRRRRSYRQQGACGVNFKIQSNIQCFKAAYIGRTVGCACVRL
jgi:hypothetical protein